MQLLKICNFHPIWYQIPGKVKKFQVCSFATSKVIGKRTRKRWKTLPVLTRLKRSNLEKVSRKLSCVLLSYWETIAGFS